LRRIRKRRNSRTKKNVKKMTKTDCIKWRRRIEDKLMKEWKQDSDVAVVDGFP
jgi:hypothetical protein